VIRTPLQMSKWRWCARLLPLAAIVGASVVSPVSAQSVVPSPSQPRGASLLPADVTWVVNLQAIPELNAPTEAGDPVGTLRQFTYLEVQGYQGEWAEVLNPRTKVSGFVPSDAIGPIDSPPAYITADPPPPVDEINADGRAIRGAALSFYPTPDPEAQTETLGHNTPIAIADSVQGDDGETWYRTADGDYLPTTAVRLPRPPVRTFAGRWIDVDLREPAMLVAYEGDRPVLTTLTIHGAGARPTPVGVFTIQRRVANETMNSDTIGIPRFGPGGYYLTNVLFTQYFTADGASIHYNYWSSNWGYAASHGCLGLTYADSAFMWNWASLGTVVSIHY
jgi:L,D-transpeptidase catalytic domain